MHLPRKSAAGSDIAQPLQSAYWPVPKVVLDIEAGAGGNELLDHARATRCCAQHERSVPFEKAGSCFKSRISIAVGTMAGLDRAKPLKSAQGPYPSLFSHCTSAPALASAIAVAVWPCVDARCSAVRLHSKHMPVPRRRSAKPSPSPHPSAITQRHTPTLGRLDRRRERKQYPPASVEWTSEPSASSTFTPPASP